MQKEPPKVKKFLSFIFAYCISLLTFLTVNHLATLKFLESINVTRSEAPELFEPWSIAVVTVQSLNVHAFLLVVLAVAYLISLGIKKVVSVPKTWKGTVALTVCISIAITLGSRYVSESI